ESVSGPSSQTHVTRPTNSTSLAVSTPAVCISQRLNTRHCREEVIRTPAHTTPAHDAFTFNRFGCLDSCEVVC
ncbi:unnamed protein product, partial [Brassica rapa subsp. narinosa]